MPIGVVVCHSFLNKRASQLLAHAAFSIVFNVTYFASQESLTLLQDIWAAEPDFALPPCTHPLYQYPPSLADFQHYIRRMRAVCFSLVLDAGPRKCLHSVMALFFHFLPFKRMFCLVTLVMFSLSKPPVVHADARTHGSIKLASLYDVAFLQ